MDTPTTRRLQRPALDGFDKFLQKQRARLKAKLAWGEERLAMRKAALLDFDIEVRKQAGTNFCISTGGGAMKARDTDGGRI